MTTRRDFLLTGVALGITVPARVGAQELTGPPMPDPSAFESGDLVWPKKQGAYVPYNATNEEANLESDEARWIDEKVAFIRLARAGKLGSTPEENVYWRRVADEIEYLDFMTFYHRYSAAASPRDFVTHGGGGILYVGHVGIIEIDAVAKKPFVIEAILGKGLACGDCVQRISYDDWLRNRGDILVWHARLKDKNVPERAAIATYARGQVGKPYRFWNFDLSNDKGFYCSKLIWQSVLRATGVVLDDIPDSRRYFWFSPLQTMRSRHLVVLSSPGNYRNV